MTLFLYPLVDTDVARTSEGVQNFGADDHDDRGCGQTQERGADRMLRSRDCSDRESSKKHRVSGKRLPNLYRLKNQSRPHFSKDSSPDPGYSRRTGVGHFRVGETSKMIPLWLIWHFFVSKPMDFWLKERSLTI